MRQLFLRIMKLSYEWRYLFFLFALTACISPFEPEINKYENLLVVDGVVSNIPGSVYIKLSKTSSYNVRKQNPVNAANVTLIDDLGNQVPFINVSNGKYGPSDPAFAGEIGRGYLIHIEAAEGIICESEMEVIPEPIPIDGVKYEFKDGVSDSEKGLQILIDVKNTGNQDAFFFWEYVETWKFEVPFISSREPDARICYRSAKPALFLINTTQNLIQKQLSDYPLYFIDNTSNRLYIKYSVNVIQHTLSEKTYVYYHDLKEVNENQGGLFDTSPITLVGNMTNLSNPEQPVLGNFQVSGAMSRRIFIENREIKDKLNVSNGFEDCLMEYAGEITGAKLLDSLAKAGWYAIDRTFNPAANDTIITLTNSRVCCDCTLSGSIKKPDFWEGE